MATGSLPEALKKIIEQRGCTQGQLARDMRIRAAWVSDVMTGKLRNPGWDKVTQLLERVGWEVHITPKGEEPDPVKRREFTSKVAQAAAGVTLMPSATLIKSDKDPEHVRALTARVRSLYLEQGSTPAAEAGLRYVQRVKAALGSTDKQLKVAVSDLARESAHAALGEQGPDVSAKLSKFALDLARSAGSGDRESLAYMELSRIHVGQGRGDYGAMYAERGLQVPDISASRRAGLEMRLARALAITPGHGRRARDAMERAQGAAEGLSRAVIIDVTGNSGVTLASLRAYDEAHASLDRAIRNTTAPASQAQWLAERSLAALSAGDPIAAGSSMGALAYVMPLIEDSTVRRDVSQIYAKSARWVGVREVREAREELREWAVQRGKQA